MLLNPQPDGKTLALSNLKAFASDNFVVAEFFYDNAVFLLWEKEKKMLVTRIFSYSRYALNRLLSQRLLSRKTTPLCMNECRFFSPDL